MVVVVVVDLFSSGLTGRWFLNWYGLAKNEQLASGFSGLELCQQECFQHSRQLSRIESINYCLK